jgi:hypothetical protein
VKKLAILSEATRAAFLLAGHPIETAAAAEEKVRGAVGRLESGAKKVLNTPIPGTPELLPAKLRGPLRKGVDFAIENPETLIGTAAPIPGGGMLAHAGKRALERGLNKIAPPKLAFAVSQYSGALNPVILSGASSLPPARAPQLRTAIQKAAFATSAYDAGPAPTWAHDRAAPSGASGVPPFRAPRLNAAVQKTAAGAPTRGNFMMASDVPAFRAPRLDQAIQKDSGFDTDPYTSVFKGADFEKTKRVKLEGDAVIEVDKKGKSLGKGSLLKEKDSDALPEGTTLQPWDNFRRVNINAKHAYAMPTEKLAAFVEGLLKEAIPGLTPQSRLEQSSSIGAPRANPPPAPGPSIADQAKPKGPGFGTGIAGANKGGIGGQSVGGIGRMASPPQV